MKEAWDKYLLIAFGVAGIACAALFGMKALAFSEQFEIKAVEQNDAMPDLKTGLVQRTQGIVASGQHLWETPNKQVGGAEMPVPLFVSVPIVEKEGRLINLRNPTNPPLRPPVTNAWLLEHGLDYLNSSILVMDADGDGFSNLEEWKGQTSPSDPADSPPYATKLSFVERKQEIYLASFSAQPDAQSFQIKRLPTAKWPQADNFYLKVGEESDDGQLRVESFTPSNTPGVQPSVKVTFLPTGEVFELARRADVPMAVDFAQISFALDPSKEILVREGDSFTLDLSPGVEYLVDQVDADSANLVVKIDGKPDQEYKIEKK